MPPRRCSYSITDADGSTVTGTLTVTFDDDAPTATSRGVAERCGRGDGHRDAGLRCGRRRRDGDAHRRHAAGVQPGDGNYSQAIDIGAGLLKVKADGSYSFTADAVTQSPVPLATATYTVTDGDGDTATATIELPGHGRQRADRRHGGCGGRR